MDLEKSVEMSAIIMLWRPWNASHPSYLSCILPVGLWSTLELTEEFSHPPNHFDSTWFALLNPCHFIRSLSNVVAQAVSLENGNVGPKPELPLICDRIMCYQLLHLGSYSCYLNIFFIGTSPHVFE